MTPQMMLVRLKE